MFSLSLSKRSLLASLAHPISSPSNAIQRVRLRFTTFWTSFNRWRSINTVVDRHDKEFFIHAGPNSSFQDGVRIHLKHAVMYTDQFYLEWRGIIFEYEYECGWMLHCFYQREAIPKKVLLIWILRVTDSSAFVWTKSMRPNLNSNLRLFAREVSIDPMSYLTILS